MSGFKFKYLDPLVQSQQQKGLGVASQTEQLLPTPSTGGFNFQYVGTPQAPVGSPNDVAENLATSRLQGQVDRQRGTLELFGQEAPKPQPSILDRIFDVMSRGQYAVVSGIHGATDAQERGDNPLAALDDFAIGAIKGLTGKNKGSFSSVIERAGIENNTVKGVGGFAGDVLLDPTTYVGVGLIKSAGKEAIQKVAKEAAESSMSSTKVLNQAGKAVQKAHQQARKTSGVPLSKEQAQEVFDREFLSLVAKAADKAAKEFEAAGPGKFQLRFGGKVIAESPKLYRGFSAFGDKIQETAAGRALNASFRPKATLPGEIHTIKRLFEGRSVGEFIEWERQWRALAKGVTKTDGERVAHAIEDGIDLTGELGEKGADLGKIQDLAKTHMEEFYNREAIDFNVLAPGQRIPNYVYHVYRGQSKNPKMAEQFKRARVTKQTIGPNVPGFAKTRTVPTLREAKDAGLDPVTNIVDIVANRAAKHYRLAAKHDFVNELGEKFGLEFTGATPAVKTGLIKKLGLTKANNPLIKGEVYVPQNINKILEGVEKMFVNSEEADKLLRLHDQALRAWKTQATVLNPGHHVRNFIGDVYLNYLDGVVNPRRYEQAARALGKTGKIKIGKATATGDEIWQLYVKTGAKTGFFKEEISEFKLKPLEWIRERSEMREDFGRLAHFIDVMVKEGKHVKPGVNRWKELEEVALKAKDRVNKFNFDYGDFTDVERRYFKRIMPFYSWLRKNLPLQLEMLAVRPGRQVVVPKAFHAIETMLGIEKDATIEDSIPHWIKEKSPLQISDGESPSFMNFGLPVQELSMLGGREGGIDGKEIMRNLLASTSPLIKAPIELTTEEQLFSGAPVDSGTQYAANQFPMARMLSNQFGEDGPTDAAMQEAWFNYLTGLGKQTATPQRRAGELRTQSDPMQKIISELRKKEREALFGQ